MANAFDVAPNDLIDKAAEQLKGMEQMQPPTWTYFAKTGTHKQRPPASNDWWFARCASLLRFISKRGPVGVNKLRTKYGGKKNRGNKPEKFFKGSGNVIRKALQQLEKAGYVKHAERGVHKGRVITPQGQSFLDKIAITIIKSTPRKPLVSAPSAPAKKPASKKEASGKQAEKAEDKTESKAEVKPAAKEDVKADAEPKVKEAPEAKKAPEAKAEKTQTTEDKQ